MPLLVLIYLPIKWISGILRIQASPCCTGLASVLFLLIVSSHFPVLVPRVESAFNVRIKPFKTPIHLRENRQLHQEDNSGDDAANSRRLVVVQREKKSMSALSGGDDAKMAPGVKTNMTGLSGDGYYVDLYVGTPPQRMQILIDTGSANFAVAATPHKFVSHFFSRDNSSTYKEDGQPIFVPYTEGEWRGSLGTDNVSFSSHPNMSARVHIACITESKDFFTENAKWQGILGLAYSELSRPDSSVVPFWDSMTSQNPQLANVFSMHLCGSSFAHTREKPLMEGTLIVGGIDPSLSLTPIYYTPVYKEWYYEVIIADMAVGGQSLALDCKEYNFDKTIVDSGTTTIHLPHAVFNALVGAVQHSVQMSSIPPWEQPGESFYSGDEVVCFRDMTRLFESFPDVSFHLQQTHNTTFRLDLSAQNYLRPVEAFTADGVPQDQPGETCVKFGFSTSTSGTVLGAVLMEAFYVVFDRNNSRVGFGQTTCPPPDPTHAGSTAPTVVGSIPTTRDLSRCPYKRPAAPQNLMVVSYVMAGLAVVVVLPLCLLAVLWVKRSCGSCDYSRRSKMNDMDTYTVLSEGH